MSRTASRAIPPGHAAEKPTVDDILATRARANKASTEFLKIDIETALTFSGTALQSDSQVKRERNRRAARRAYDTVLCLLGKVRLSEDEAQVISGKLERLKSELTRLGEQL